MKTKFIILKIFPILCLCFNFFKVNAQLAQQQKIIAGEKIEKRIYSESNRTVSADTENQSFTIANNSAGDLAPIQRMSGKTEDVAKRDAFSKHYRNEDGSFTAVIGSGAIHYKKDGKWEDIDTKIKKSSTGNFAYENKTNLFESYFGATSKDGVLTKNEKGELREFLNTAMFWEVNGEKINVLKSSPVDAEVKDNFLYYKNIFGDIDAEFSVLNIKRKLNYIIPNKSSLGNIPENAKYLVFSEDIELPLGWTFSIDAKKNILIKNKSGEVAFVYPAPTVGENYNSDQPSLPILDNPASFEVFQKGNLLTVFLKVKKDWLNSDNRKFPIAIDPTVYPNNATGWTGWATSTGGNDDALLTGYYSDGYAMIGFMRFNLSSIPDNSLIGTVTSDLNYYQRFGSLNGNRMAIAISTVDSLPTTTLYADIWGGATRYISDFVSWTNTSQGTIHWKQNNFSAEGIAYVQDALSKDFVNVAAAPFQSNTWGINNYAWFYGYSSANRPYLTINYTTTCTTPSSTANTFFINNVQFLGTLIPNTTSGNTGYSATGYSNSNTNMATQIPGGVVNVYVSNNSISNFTKAWVDWNRNGIFDSSEKVYDSGNILVPNTTFGFVIPAGTAANTYKIRIRNYKESQYFYACGAFLNGETEDYTFTVIADCAAKITGVNTNAGDGKRCGAGTVTVSAQATAGATLRWYNNEFGGTAITGTSGNSYTTPSLAVGTYTYYVTAFNGCESVFRTPVKIVVSPTPVVNFNLTNPEMCGTVASLTLTSSGDKEEVNLINEKFDSGLGLFENNTAGNTNSDAVWQNKTSPWVPTTPPYYALKPALYSGYSNGNFAVINTDVYQGTNVLNHLSLINNVNSTGYLNLKLDFDLFYYSMIDNDITYGYFRVDYSINGGGTWTNLAQILTDTGTPGKWNQQSLTLPAAALNQTQLKIRFSCFAYGLAGTGWVANLAAIDNVRLYGDKPLTTNFTWSGDTNVIFDATTCNTAPSVSGSASVCIKPPVGELETKQNWTVTATAILSNGCSASGTISVANNSKIWNNASSVNNWNTLNWKPNTAIPLSDKCVIIKSPVNILGATNAVAKSVKVEAGGKLDIAAGASLSVSEGFINEAGTADVVVNSDGNLLQINDSPSPANSGTITAKRNLTFSAGRQQYNYLISPLEGYNLKNIYKDISGNPVVVPFTLYHIESTNTFQNSSGAYIKGRALAVKEPTSASFNAATMGATFTGTPTNGSFTYNIINSNTANLRRGFNLIGNPYPSNIDLVTFYNLNGGSVANLSPTFYFWDNRANSVTQQQGDLYTGQGYAQFNAATPTGIGSGTAATGDPGLAGTKIPNRYVKTAQGFMTKTTAASKTLTFNNTIRTINTTAQNFFGKGKELEPNRFWIDMISPLNITSNIVIVYFEEGINGYTEEDSRSMLGSDAVYSLVDGEKISINGKSSFVKTDVVPLGSTHFVTGIYKIALSAKEGIFANGQNVYLKDKLKGIVTNLSEGSYSFDAIEGESSDRFEIIYEPETILATGGNVKNDIQVYRDGNQLVVNSQNKKLTAIELFDSSGRLIFQSDINTNKTAVNTANISSGMYLLKIFRNNDVVSRKVIIQK